MSYLKFFNALNNVLNIEIILWIWLKPVHLHDTGRSFGLYLENLVFDSAQFFSVLFIFAIRRKIGKIYVGSVD